MCSRIRVSPTTMGKQSAMAATACCRFNSSREQSVSSSRVGQRAGRCSISTFTATSSFWFEPAAPESLRQSGCRRIATSQRRCCRPFPGYRWKRDSSREIQRGQAKIAAAGQLVAVVAGVDCDRLPQSCATSGFSSSLSKHARCFCVAPEL